MKTINLHELHTIPRMGHLILYPGGFPLKPDQHHVNGKSMKELYSCYDKDSLIEEEIENLREYIIYYMFAPCWDKQILKEEVGNDDLRNYKIWDLMEICFSMGIDPDF